MRSTIRSLRRIRRRERRRPDPARIGLRVSEAQARARIDRESVGAR